MELQEILLKLNCISESNPNYAPILSYFWARLILEVSQQAVKEKCGASWRDLILQSSYSFNQKRDN
jgi:hypothetical protein